MFYRSLLMTMISVLMTACATSPGDDLPPFGETLRRETMAAQTWEHGDTAPTLQGRPGYADYGNLSQPSGWPCRH